MFTSHCDSKGGIEPALAEAPEMNHCLTVKRIDMKLRQRERSTPSSGSASLKRTIAVTLEARDLISMQIAQAKVILHQQKLLSRARQK